MQVYIRYVVWICIKFFFSNAANLVRSKTLQLTTKFIKITKYSKTSHRTTNSISKLSKLKAQERFDGLMKTLCEREGRNIDGADVDGATS